MYSTEELLEQLQELTRKLGHVPSVNEYIGMAKHSSVLASHTVYVRRFSSWNNALEAAGLPVRKSTKDTSYSREVLIEQLQEISRVLGRTPSMTEIDNATPATGQYASAQTFANHFGTYYNALRAARLIPRHIRRPYRTEYVEHE